MTRRVTRAAVERLESGTVGGAPPPYGCELRSRVGREVAFKAPRAGRLCAEHPASEGVKAALEAEHGAGLPPGSIRTPRGGAGGEA